MLEQVYGDKQLDCEGIDISAEKGKVNIIELEELSLYTKDQIKKYGEKKYQEYKDSLINILIRVFRK